jgi:hypothetical protein
MARVEVIGIRDREIRERTLALKQAQPFRIGSVLIDPDTLIATWTRDRIVSGGFKSHANWRMVALKVEGPRIVVADILHHDRREFRFERVDDAPKWMSSLANVHIPQEEFE